MRAGRCASDDEIDAFLHDGSECLDKIIRSLKFSNYLGAIKNLDNSCINCDAPCEKACISPNKVNIKDIINKYQLDENNPIVKIAMSVYEKYSRAIDELTLEKGKTDIQLPIGLPSAFILQNMIFSEFDSMVYDCPTVLSYSRYVDDVMFVVGRKINCIEEIFPIIKGENKNKEARATRSLSANSVQTFVLRN